MRGGKKKRGNLINKPTKNRHTGIPTPAYTQDKTVSVKNETKISSYQRSSARYLTYGNNTNSYALEGSC